MCGHNDQHDMTCKTIIGNLVNSIYLFISAKEQQRIAASLSGKKAQ